MVKKLPSQGKLQEASSCRQEAPCLGLQNATIVVVSKQLPEASEICACVLVATVLVISALLLPFCSFLCMAMIEGPGSDILKSFRKETGKVNEDCSVPGL